MVKSTIVDIDGYTILRRLGTGARSTIYLAVQEDSKTTVAIKRAILESPEDTRIFEQMETEYKVSRQIDHPYIRKCYDIIRNRKLLRTNELILIMEYFEGQNLEDQQRLSMGDVLLVFRMVAIALNAMHEKGYVHCDIKPNNILFSPKGGIKIIDLGQSCRLGEIKKRIQGTPDYIAPEQVRREHLSHRTDIFNLGATMYWALTGRNVPTLIPKKNEMGIAIDETASFKSPNELYRKIPKTLSDLVMECVQEKPADRPSNMSEIIDRLDVMIREIFGSRTSGNAPKVNTTLS
ncbi:MAG TPA: serine/threonine-protein kinase [Anaerohalosphaeraceae bacterium]|nr:serine/threonine protein kinase [Phycisphaerae bacterium]HOL32791.1 serine/threonine-protein kinase [Anaerohalosphaeraceae bacterium]HOM75013.1 serine/threonine-protein kinase [Anaerohalosphaeraceae bacterium]HPC63649.1 serine/threonine-protein kinase [Anaerohalosphaeraceae bacterium]HPO68905.1 serine/threonine-protein kinase [Anaerohalosphaeraceae bacterium]